MMLFNDENCVYFTLTLFLLMLVIYRLKAGVQSLRTSEKNQEIMHFACIHGVLRFVVSL
jgi:hypothetical protein